MIPGSRRLIVFEFQGLNGQLKSIVYTPPIYVQYIVLDSEMNRTDLNKESFRIDLLIYHQINEWIPNISYNTYSLVK